MCRSTLFAPFWTEVHTLWTDSGPLVHNLWTVAKRTKRLLFKEAMAQFKLTGIPEKNTVSINKKTVFYTCCFRVPQELRDMVSAERLDELERDQLMGFYCKPSIGSTIESDGCFWRVIAEHHSPVPYKSKTNRQVPKLHLEALEGNHSIPEIGSYETRIEE